MATVKEIYEYLDALAPFSLQMDFDNSGFLVGRGEAFVKKIMVALDITQEVIDEAVTIGCQLIVSHHPIIFRPAKSMTDGGLVGKCLLALAENHVAAICAHTNLDVVAGGVNDALAQKLKLSQVELLHRDGLDAQGRPYGIGRVGTVNGFGSTREFAAFVQMQLNAKGLRLEDAGRPVHKVAVGGGACGEYMKDAVNMGCDTFVTADIKYNTFLDAKELGLNLIDAGHFSTENVVCPVLAQWLTKGFPDVEIIVSNVHKEVFSCI